MSASISWHRGTDALLFPLDCRAPGGPLPTPAAGSRDEVFLAFGRVFSGVIRDGMTVGAAPLGACLDGEGVSAPLGTCPDGEGVAALLGTCPDG